MEKLVRSFMCDLNSVPVKRLSTEVETAYIKIAKDMTKPASIRIAAENAVFKNHIPFVIACARKFASKDLPVTDLVNEGFIGLKIAMKHYNPDTGIKFISYAVWWIRETIQCYIRQKRNLIRIPENRQSMLREFNKQAQKTNGRVEDIAENAGMAKQIADMFNALNPVSLDTPVGTGKTENMDLLLGDTLSTTSLPDDLEKKRKNDQLYAVIETLPVTESDILKSYYGFNTGEKESLTEIGKAYNRSKERIRQLKDRALKHLSASLKETGFENF